MCPSSPAWGHGLAHGTLGPLGMGASISAYSGEFRPERLLEAIKAHKITTCPQQRPHRMMRASPRAEHYHLTLTASFTGEALDGPRHRPRARLGPICSIYGTTEVGVIRSISAHKIWWLNGSLVAQCRTHFRFWTSRKKRARQIKLVNSSPTPERLVATKALLILTSTVISFTMGEPTTSSSAQAGHFSVKWKKPSWHTKRSQKLPSSECRLCAWSNHQGVCGQSRQR